MRWFYRWRLGRLSEKLRIARRDYDFYLSTIKDVLDWEIDVLENKLQKTKGRLRNDTAQKDS